LYKVLRRYYINILVIGGATVVFGVLNGLPTKYSQSIKIVRYTHWNLISSKNLKKYYNI